MKTHRFFLTKVFEYSLILFFFLSLCSVSCASPQIQNDFYRGLNDSANSVSHFEKALTSSNVYIKQAAAEELAKLMAEGKELSAGTVQRVRREAADRWAAAFQIADSLNKDRAVEFLVGHEQGFPGEARLYVLQEFGKKNVFFSDHETAATEGHFAVSALRYNEALALFRSFQEDGSWPQTVPDLFLKYPVLINDLGRAFQYTSSGTEGLSLFLQWEENLSDNFPGAQGLLFKTEDIRYRLLFFAARIARRSGRTAQAISLFEQSLPFAPEGEQKDACIWYILDASLNDTDVFMGRLGQLVHYWHSGRYFDDILERFLYARASAQEWDKIISVLNIIKNSNSPMRAGYAWIISRVMEEGFLSYTDLNMAASLFNAGNEPLQRSLQQFTYNAGNGITSALYYRSLSAAALNRPFLEYETSSGRNERPSPALQFLLGFFTHDAADHVHRYIRQMERELSVNELRAVAQALNQAGIYAQSMRLVSQYINSEGYALDRRDLELLFPAAFRELVEKNAAETGIAPQILFGLIRTESAFQSSVISRAGAVGLTQLMPATAEEMAGRIRRAGGPDYAARENGLDLSDPAVNVHIGTFYLNYLMDRFDDMYLSLLSYNGGMNRVRRWLAVNTLPIDIFAETIPIFETRDYGKKVIAAAAVYEELYYRQNR